MLLRVDRRPEPPWVRPARLAPPTDALRHATGGQLEWSYAIPWVFRVLASPATAEPLLAAPRPGDPPSTATAYWSALLHLLIYTFGWARPDRGLRWWYDAGRPTDDLRLHLMAETWGADGQLDWFAAWLWTAPFTPPLATLRTATGSGAASSRVEVDPAWLAVQVGAAEAAGVPVPIGGGWDPLHLSTHCAGPLEPPSGEVVLLSSSPTERRAVLLVDSMIGWYRALVDAGACLPPLGMRSWHVDVVVRPVGWLGTYRRSRQTGLWFSGPHHLHLVGT